MPASKRNSFVLVRTYGVVKKKQKLLRQRLAEATTSTYVREENPAKTITC